MRALLLPMSFLQVSHEQKKKKKGQRQERCQTAGALSAEMLNTKQSSI